MDFGVEHMKQLVASGRVARFPELFFNMDADSALGERALERMVYRLTRKRRLTGRPYHIVTSNVIVPFEQCLGRAGARSSASRAGSRCWWRGSTSGRSRPGKVNYKLSPTMEVSGALYCTWSDIYLAAPRYAAFMQQLRLRDWLKWWIGCPPPRFSEFRGDPLPEAMTGPGDDTWMGWFAACCKLENGRFTPEFPRTPLHALAAALLQYLSRTVVRPPRQGLQQDAHATNPAPCGSSACAGTARACRTCSRHWPSLAYHWKAGASRSCSARSSCSPPSPRSRSRC